MTRIIIICEGQTEKEFCTTILAPYLLSKKIAIQTPLIKKSMGGIVKWVTLKKQIETHLKSDRKSYVTTLIDYYGLYSTHEFPNWLEAEREPDKNKKMEILEEGMHKSIDDNIGYRYIPYLQLHEFEGLLFIDQKYFHEQIPRDDLVGLDELSSIFEEFDNPEMINNGKNTAPSHRLKRIIRGYRKIIYGSILAEAIGIENIRSKSPRFNKWIEKIETLS